MLTDSPENPGPPIDRLAPARRPDQRPLMFQKWRSLLFLHWEFSPDAVRTLLPSGLELDLFNGRAYVGLVPFTMRGVRPVGLPAVPGISNFHETNVRTYVHKDGQDPGVWFFSLEAASAVAVVLARSLFHLPYHHAQMRLFHHPDGSIAYTSRRHWPGPVPATTEIRCTPQGRPAPATIGTRDHFLLERYLLYAKGPRWLIRGQVHHTPYPIQGAEIHGVEETLLAASRLTRPDHVPLVHYSEGVDVEIFSTRRVSDS